MTDNKKQFEGIDKAPRANKAREKTQQRKPWAPASSLDAPPAPEGYKHRWIRAEARGFMDTKNVSARLREGYELVRASEYPDFESPVVDSGKYEGVFGVGGLLLARIPLETVSERNAYYQGRAKDLQEAVDQNLMASNNSDDARRTGMVVNNPERQSRVTFGGSQKE
jgi:hypothetical protein|tara:strand:- start:457 stop:957 length:501 start_codon:yes stop_codon:yes gene_type:complete